MAKSGAENEPSELDESTHAELRTMHQSASLAILFAKFVQWLGVGISVTMFAAAIFMEKLSAPGHSLQNLLSVTIILMTCATIFVLIMYQMWQFNEIRRIRNVERYFSTLCRHINNIESRKERNVERYTMLGIMVMIVVAGAIISITAIR